MFSKVNLNSDQTQASFGYRPEDLPTGSHCKVVVECSNCNRLIHREYRNVNAKHQCPVVNGNEKRCFKCGEWKDLSLFNKNPRTSGGVAKMCRQCYNKHEAVKASGRRKSKRLRDALSVGDIGFYIRHRLYNYEKQSKDKSIPFDLDFDYLMNLWGEGICHYSGLKMNGSMKQEGFQAWDSPSLDRKDPSKGYTKGNVVWCIFSINSFKQSLNYDTFESMIKSIKWWYKNKENHEKRTY